MRSESIELLSALRRTSAVHGMFTPGQTVVVGVSGGPDSTALLRALTELRAEWQLTLIACHINHGFRGAEADADGDFVRALCERLDVTCHIQAVDVPSMKKRRHLSSQQAAREARHAILRRVAADTNADRIALAHTRDDRAETVLLNILRGTGLEGLAGFPPADLPLVRPFYDVTRAQVERYCALHDLQARQDSSNLKTDYRRNRVRLELLPYLREHFNLKADDALLRLADLAREDNACLDQIATDLVTFFTSPTLDLLAAYTTDDKPTYPQEPKLTLAAADLNAYPSALRRRLLRQAIARVRGHLQNVSLHAVESLLEAAAGGRDASVELPADANGTVRVVCDSARITIFRAPVLKSVPKWEILLATPGRTSVSQAGVFIDVEIGRVNELTDILSRRRMQSSKDIHSAIFIWNRAEVEWPLLARSWQPGDRMRPRGLGGTKKIQDIFTDIKLPAWQRRQVPLLVEAGGRGRILAAGEWRADETALLSLRLPIRADAFEAAMERLKAQTNSSQELLMAAIGYG